MTGLPPGVAADVQLAVYRIVQEAVTNAIRHSACHQISIAAGTSGGLVEVVVTDDGIGVQPTGQGRSLAGSGFGTLGMLDRADALGGRLTWTTPREGGTMVRLLVDPGNVHRDS